MIREEDVFEIGFINKPHGTRGEMLMTLSDDAFDMEESGTEFIFCMLDGILVPFYIEEYRYRSDTTLLVKLEGVDNEEKARRLTNVKVYVEEAPYSLDEDSALSWNFFRGCTVEDTKAGPLGTISRVDTSTINTLFIIKQENSELLVPAQEEFIQHIDREHRHVVMQLPEGLLSLNDPATAKENVF